MKVHPKKAIGDRVRSTLPVLIGAWQHSAPDRLLPTPYVTARAAADLSVSGGVVRKHLTDAVADGDLLEVLVRRDWLVMLPHSHEVLPLYAVPDGELYRLAPQRPASRGSNGISFLTTRAGFWVLLSEVGKEFSGATG